MAIKLKGRGLKKRDVYQIMYRARQTDSIRECPYTLHSVRWCIWTTSFKNKEFTHDQVYQALLDAGVPVDA